MGDLTEYTYNQTNKLMQATMTTFLSFLKILADNIYDQISYAPYKKLAQWIREGGECAIYQVQAPDGQLDAIVNDMRRRIEKEQLGALRITDSGLIIVPEPHLEKIQEINRTILVERSNYYQEVSLNEFMDKLGSLDGRFNKDVLILKGISEYEAEVIKNKTNVITKGFMVGISDPKIDGTYDLGVRAEHVFMTDTEKGKTDFCKASLNAMISLWGVNHDLKINELENDAQVDRLIYEAANSDAVKYVAGSDKKSYLEISSAGFSRYSMAAGKNGHFAGTLEKRVDRSDVNFYSELEIQLDKIMDEKLFDSIDELNKHLVSKEKGAKHGDPDSPRRRDANMQHNLVDEMDRLIKDKMISNINFALLDTEAKYNCYMAEASNLLLALSNEELGTPAGYTPEEMKLLSSCLFDNERMYGDKSESQQNKTVFSRVATKINNLNAEVQTARPLDEQAKETIRKEREHGNFSIENR